MTTGTILPESALAIARSRVGESIAAHARSIGMLNLPADRLALMTDHAVKLLEGLSPGELSKLSPSSGQLVMAVATSFNLVYGQLSEGQLRALKQGIDPSNVAAVQAFLAGSLRDGGGASGATGLLRGRANYRDALDGSGGASAQKLADYSSQYRDLALAQNTIGLFAAIGLNRASYNAFAKEGYSSAAIQDAATDTRALGWKGTGAFGDAIHAPEKIRKAGVAAATAKTDEERSARDRELETIYEGLSPEDQQKAAPFLKRLNETHKLEAEKCPAIARAIVDASLTSTRAASADKTDLDNRYRKVTEADASRPKDGADANLLSALDVGPGSSPSPPSQTLRPARPTGAATPT